MALRTMGLLAVLAFLGLTDCSGIMVSVAYAQTEQEATAAYDRGAKLRERGAFREAITELETALQLYRRLQGEESVDVGYCSLELGNIHYSMGQSAKAEPFYRRTLDVFEARL